MADTQFQRVRLDCRWPEAEDLVGLKFDLTGTDLAASFANPGQYVQIRTPGGHLAYMAIASKPGEPAFEFLVKAGGAASDELTALRPGDALDMTAATGPGYPIQGQTGKDVLLFAVGSGISPIRSLIWHLAGRREDYKGVTLFFGARTPEHFAYRQELAAWEQAGIRVVRVVSRPVDSAAGFVHGYVQDALESHPIVPGETVAFLCGMPAMVAGVERELAARGVPPEQIHQNV